MKAVLGIINLSTSYSMGISSPFSIQGWMNWACIMYTTNSKPTDMHIFLHAYHQSIVLLRGYSAYTSHGVNI